MRNLVSSPRTPRHLLHVFASFGMGGVPIRICDVLNALPGDFRHTIVSLDRCLEARTRLAPHVAVEFRDLELPKYFLPATLHQFWSFLRDVSPDLLLTYNWGTIECSLANRLCSIEQIHFESGFGVEEALGQLWRRTLFRRIALRGVRNLVVPSLTLMGIARDAWHIPPSKLLHIPNGVDAVRYSGVPGKRASFMARPDGSQEIVIGTVAPLRPEKNIGRLLRVFAALPRELHCKLSIAGDGSALTDLQATAARLGINDRCQFLGHVDDVPSLLNSIDIFALSSDTEQMPNALLQAMAAGRPVAAVDVGDVCAMVAEENRPFVVSRNDETGLAASIARLAADPLLRENLGRLNQERIQRRYTLEAMVTAYRGLFEGSRAPA